MNRETKIFLENCLKKKSTPPTIHPKEKVKKTNPNKCLPKSQLVLLGDKNATDKKIFSTPTVK